jgi:hypothetical protein
MMSIHAEVGMQCADCHFSQDSHGNGLIYGEVANAVEISCKDCHGTADAYPTLLTSNLAARPKGKNLGLLRNANGERRFEWFDDPNGKRVLIQRSIVDPKLSWRVSLVKNSVDRSHPDFNPKAARAKLMSKSGAETGKYAFGSGVAKEERAHKIWSVSPATSAGQQAAGVAICRSKRTGRPTTTNMKVVRRGTMRPITRRLPVTRCSSWDVTRRARAMSLHRSVQLRP